MTLYSSGLPAFALMSSLLAVSSLHRYGLQDLAFRYKIAAINALVRSAESGPRGILESAQHAATCLVLATFEVQHHSNSSGQWVFYVEGAKHVLQATRPQEKSDQGELSPLLDWIFYLDTMSWYNMRHWHHPSTLPHSTVDRINPKTTQNCGTWPSVSTTKHNAHCPYKRYTNGARLTLFYSPPVTPTRFIQYWNRLPPFSILSLTLAIPEPEQWSIRADLSH